MGNNILKCRKSFVKLTCRSVVMIPIANKKKLICIQVVLRVYTSDVTVN